MQIKITVRYHLTLVRIAIIKKPTNMEMEMATHSSFLAWRIPMDSGAGRPQTMGSQRVGHD